jgi:hypothetical protein
MPGPKPPQIVLSENERLALEHRVRAHTTGQGLVRRARVVLLAAIGYSNVDIARLVPKDEEAVGLWRRRWFALRIVLANETINFALASAFNVVFAAATFILFGLAVALGGGYPRWLGWVVVLAGVGSIGAGLVQALTSQPTDLSRILTIIGPTVITLWLLVIGVLLVRKRPAVMGS